MNIEEQKALLEQVKTQASAAASNEIKAQFTTITESAEKVAKEAVKGLVSAETMKEFTEKSEAASKRLDDVLKAQGLEIEALKLNVQKAGTEGPSLSQLMAEDETKLKAIHSNGQGVKSYMLTPRSNGNGFNAYRMEDVEKAAGPHATVGAVGGATNVASITSTLTAAQILRAVGAGDIMSQFRNRPWVFDLCNTTTASITERLCVWMDELAGQGSSATVAEGATKPLRQSAYELQASSWKKEAMLMSFTQEFGLDFPGLEQDILAKGVIDLINRVNSAILPDIITNATAFSQVASGYTSPGGALKNKWNAIAAMASQVENATYAPMANAAIMGVGDKYELGTQVTSQGEWLDAPQVVQNIGIVSNPAMAADAVLVGDFKNYNIKLKGGIIVKQGYNGTNFADNMYSTVIEQLYFNYISNVKKSSIVKGPDFTTVLAAI